MNAKRAGRKAAWEASSLWGLRAGAIQPGQNAGQRGWPAPHEAAWPQTRERPCPASLQGDRERHPWEPAPESGLENSLLVQSGVDVTLSQRSPWGRPREKILGIIFGAS